PKIRRYRSRMREQRRLSAFDARALRCEVLTFARAKSMRGVERHDGNVEAHRRLELTARRDQRKTICGEFRCRRRQAAYVEGRASDGSLEQNGRRICVRPERKPVPELVSEQGRKRVVVENARHRTDKADGERRLPQQRLSRQMLTLVRRLEQNERIVASEALG